MWNSERVQLKLLQTTERLYGQTAVNSSAAHKTLNKSGDLQETSTGKQDFFDYNNTQASENLGTSDQNVVNLFTGGNQNNWGFNQKVEPGFFSQNVTPEIQQSQLRC